MYGCRKFGRTTKASILCIIALPVVLIALLQQVKLHVILLAISDIAVRLRATKRALLRKLAQLSGDLGATFANALLLLLPRLSDLPYHILEAATARKCALSLWTWPVGATKDRLQIGSNKDVQRPTTSTGSCLQEVHVLPINVGTFLAIDLDWDEVVVQQLGDARVGKALVSHDMAPVASAVANAHKERTVGLLCKRQCFRTP